MGFNGWKQTAADSPADAEKIPDGYEGMLKIIKAIRGKKDGSTFESKNNDPQLGIVVVDEMDREAFVMLTLSDRAAWKLAQILEACGCNLDRMDSDGVTPQSFADERFAQRQLLDRVFKARVTYKDERFAEVTPLRKPKETSEPTPPKQEKPPARTQPAKQNGDVTAPADLKDDDLPFGGGTAKAGESDLEFP